ncbi:MAG TPA: hypothetical protein PK133_08335 [Ferruginibacter sp.]|nr:hypothetical protein [Ferruginibacter sp.]
MKKPNLTPLVYLFLLLIVINTAGCNGISKANIMRVDEAANSADTINTPAGAESASSKLPARAFDTAAYNKKMLELSNHDSTGKWPVSSAYPLPGAIFPDNRVIAYYGNLYSTRMGILGEIPKDSMFKKLQQEVAEWQAADPSTKTLPALHYIATTAQGSAGRDGKYRLRMPFHQIDTIMNWASQINALVFVDIQVGHSTVKDEVPLLEKYLRQPNVHLGIDPEFSMKNGERPGSKIGTFTSDDINDAIDFLAEVVRKNDLSPKVLVVHRFTQGMVTGYDKIKKVPEVQVVIDMDGFGDKILKRSTYLRYIYKEPVQFTGFKLFYKNDTKNTSGIYTPEELLKFTPKPVYIQYQ